jgi:hypothetical protein
MVLSKVVSLLPTEEWDLLTFCQHERVSNTGQSLTTLEGHQDYLPVVGCLEVVM